MHESLTEALRGKWEKQIFGDPFSKSDLSHVYDLRTGEDKRFCQNNLSKSLNCFLSVEKNSFCSQSLFYLWKKVEKSFGRWKKSTCNDYYIQHNKHFW